MSDARYDYASSQIITDLVSEFHCSKCSGLIEAWELSAFASVKCPKCDSTETVPARFCNFLLLEVISTNPTRTIYRARDESLGRFVIIKILPAKFSADPKFIAEFRDEARTVSKLNHENITQIYSFGVEKRQPYIVMEMLNGEFLDQVIEENNGIPLSTAIRICYDVSLGLQAAAEAGIVHKNIKPSNIILNKLGSPKITGFGLMKTSHTVDTSMVCGTPHYISPEQIRKQKIEVCSNIYSLGATLYHMIIGNPPFAEKNNLDTIIAHLEQCPTEIKKLRPEIPANISDVVKRMLQPDPSKRYHSYKALLSDLDKAMYGHDNIPATPSSISGKQIKFKKKKLDPSKIVKPNVVNKPLPAIITSHKVVKKPLPAKIPAPKFIKPHDVPSQKTAVKKKIVINSSKHKIVNKPSPRITPKANNHQHQILADKEHERHVHMRQKKQRKTRVMVAIIISFIALSILAIFIAYNMNENKLARIERHALKNSREISLNIFDQINQNISSATNNIIVAADLQKEIKEAWQDLNGKSASSISSTTNDLSINKIPNENGLLNNINFDFKDENLPEVIKKAVIVKDSATRLAIINEKLLSLKQNAESLYQASCKSITSEMVKSQNINLKKAEIKSLEYKTNVGIAGEKIKKAHEEILIISEAHVAEVERRRQAAIEAERQRLEAIRLEEERLAHEALIKRELKQVVDNHAALGTNSLLFISNDFKGIVKNLKEDFKSYQTDEGKKSAGILIERFNAIAGLKEEIIVCVNKYTFPWGWGNHLAKCDIIKADDKGIYVKNRSHPWGSANVPQMLKFIDYYLSLNNISSKSKSRLALGGAVFCAEYGEKGKAKSEELKTKALAYGINESKLNSLLSVHISGETQ